MSHKLVAPFYVVCIPFILLPHFYDALQRQSMALCVDKLSLWFLLHAGFLLRPVMLRMRVKTRGKVFLNNFEDLIIYNYYTEQRRVKTAFFVCLCAQLILIFTHNDFLVTPSTESSAMCENKPTMIKQHKWDVLFVFFSYTQTLQQVFCSVGIAPFHQSLTILNFIFSFFHCLEYLLRRKMAGA